MKIYFFKMTALLQWFEGKEETEYKRFFPNNKLLDLIENIGVVNILDEVIEDVANEHCQNGSCWTSQTPENS